MNRNWLSLAVATSFFLLLVGTRAIAGDVLVESGSAMNYLTNGADPGIGDSWTQELFDVSGWQSGIYGVGYETGSGALNLLQTTVAAATSSVYTRATFTVADVSAVNNLFFGADYDDGTIAWINGVEV